MTADERARAAIGAALVQLMRDTTEAPLPPDLQAIAAQLDPIPPVKPRKRRLWSR